MINIDKPMTLGFNTVNGKYCCNLKQVDEQANTYVLGFNTVNGKYCCNLESDEVQAGFVQRFNTVNGKYCCNVIPIWDYF